MYIRRTTIKSRKNGEPYYTYRLVESIRTDKGVRQRTLLNLGREFAFPREIWPDLAARIESIIKGQESFIKLDKEPETAAQHYAAMIIQAQVNSEGEINESKDADYHNVNIDSLELIRPRSISVEHVAYEAIQKLELDLKLKELGFNKHQFAVAIGSVIGRMTAPGSELSTHYWLQNHSGLGELIDYDFEGMGLTRIYHASDMLLKHKEALEQHLYEKQRTLFEFEETITLYDLTNTYFEGSGKFNKLAARGHSKEKRSDCPLVTLALVLDGSGFPKKSKVFAGNASEPATLQEMICKLEVPKSDESSRQKCVFEGCKPTVVCDAGIATEDNINWLKEHQYKYLVVSRKRHREFSEDDAIEVKRDRDYVIKVQKKTNAETGEVELYCHSTRKEEKEKSIQGRFSMRLEEALKKVDQGLNKKGCTKKYDKVIEKIGRLKESYSKAAKNYEITVKKDEKSGNAVKVKWAKKDNPNSADVHPGVYCLRTNNNSWDEETLWKTYTMLTDLESVFRSLKTDLGLRPVFHQIARRVSGHLFISLLAYHIVHTIRVQLKKSGINSDWTYLRKQLAGQSRITVSMTCQDGSKIHIRKSTSPEPRQKEIYDVLRIEHHPGKRIKKVEN